jgi:uncharacterized protein HemX
MPPFGLTHDASPFRHSITSNTTERHSTIRKIEPHRIAYHIKSLFSRSTHILHRRDASPGVIGIVVGLTLIATIIGVGLFAWNWNTLKQMEARKNQKRRKKHNHHHHSHLQRHHHTTAHLSANLEHNENNSEHMPIEEGQHQETHHHPNCQHQRLHHRHDHPTTGDWTPQQPEPILRIPSGWSQHRHSLQPPNEMDAPQIHGGWNMPHFFGQRRNKWDRVARP